MEVGLSAAKRRCLRMMENVYYPKDRTSTIFSCCTPAFDTFSITSGLVLFALVLLSSSPFIPPQNHPPPSRIASNPFGGDKTLTSDTTTKVTVQLRPPPIQLVQPVDAISHPPDLHLRLPFERGSSPNKATSTSSPLLHTTRSTAPQSFRGTEHLLLKDRRVNTCSNT